MKAILITKSNQKRVAALYTEGLTQEELDVEYPVNNYVVSDFGDEGFYEGVLSEAAFNEKFVKMGRDLRNGWIEVERKT